MYQLPYPWCVDSRSKYSLLLRQQGLGHGILKKTSSAFIVPIISQLNEFSHFLNLPDDVILDLFNHNEVWIGHLFVSDVTKRVLRIGME